MIFDHNLGKFHPNPKIVYYINFCDAFIFIKLESTYKFCTTLLIKNWSYQFLSLIDFVDIKIFIIASAKILLP